MVGDLTKPICLARLRAETLERIRERVTAGDLWDMWRLMGRLDQEGPAEELGLEPAERVLLRSRELCLVDTFLRWTWQPSHEAWPTLHDFLAPLGHREGRICPELWGVGAPRPFPPEVVGVLSALLAPYEGLGFARLWRSEPCASRLRAEFPEPIERAGYEARVSAAFALVRSFVRETAAQGLWLVVAHFN